MRVVENVGAMSRGVSAEKVSQLQGGGDVCSVSVYTGIVFSVLICVCNFRVNFCANESTAIC